MSDGPNGNLYGVISILLVQGAALITFWITSREKAGRAQLASVEKAQQLQRDDIREMQNQIDHLRELHEVCERDKIMLKAELLLLAKK